MSSREISQASYKCDPREWNAVENCITNRVNFLLYNYRAMDTLLRGMVDSEVNKILFLSCTTFNEIWCTSTTAKEIWNTLKKIHEGTPIKSLVQRVYAGHIRRIQQGNQSITLLFFLEAKTIICGSFA